MRVGHKTTGRMGQIKEAKRKEIVEEKIEMKLIKFKQRGRQKYTQSTAIQQKTGRDPQIYFRGNCVFEPYTTAPCLLISVLQWRVQYL